MKILCVIQRFSPSIGGSEQLAERYLDFLSQNHDVTVYTSDAYELDSFWNDEAKRIVNDTKKNYNVKRYQVLIPAKVPKNLLGFPFSVSVPGPFCPEMWKDLIEMKEKFDLIIATSFPYDHIIPAFVASNRYKIPLLIIPHLHLEFPELYLTGLRLMLLSASSAIVVNTNSEKQKLLDYGIAENRIYIIPPGINITPKNTNSIFRKRIGISEKSTVILFAGLKSTAKGVISLLDSFKVLLKKHDNLEIVLMGSSTSEFEQYITKQDSKYLNHVHDLGVVSEEVKNEAFSSCDIFALPSKSESFGISYLEAWLYKKPVIGCKIRAVSDLVENDKDGILVEFGNISEISKAIEKLFDQELRTKLGEAGFIKLCQRYDSDKLCREFEKICLSVNS